MSEQQTQDRRAERAVDPDDQVVAFVHGLGGPVIVRAYGPDGQPVGYVADVEITENEVEVVVVPGSVAKLVAEPRPPEADEG